MPSVASTTKATSRRTKDPKKVAMGKAAKRRGAKWERNLVTYFGKVGKRVSRLRSPGVGDLAGWNVAVTLDSGEVVNIPLSIEAKDQAEIKLSTFVDQAERDANGGLFIVIIKRRQKGTGKAYVTTSLECWLKMMSAVPPENFVEDEGGEADDGEAA